MPATSTSEPDGAPLSGTAALGGLPGLGPASTAMLRSAGIRSVTQLKRLGSARAFVQVQAAGLRPSLNLLWAIEGALTGLPWRQVARFERTRLLLEVDDVKSVPRRPWRWTELHRRVLSPGRVQGWLQGARGSLKADTA